MRIFCVLCPWQRGVLGAGIFAFGVFDPHPSRGGRRSRLSQGAGL